MFTDGRHEGFISLVVGGANIFRVVQWRSNQIFLGNEFCLLIVIE